MVPRGRVMWQGHPGQVPPRPPPSCINRHLPPCPRNLPGSSSLLVLTRNGTAILPLPRAVRFYSLVGSAFAGERIACTNLYQSFLRSSFVHVVITGVSWSLSYDVVIVEVLWKYLCELELFLGTNSRAGREFWLGVNNYSSVLIL